MLATYKRRMRNNNLEIRIAGSSCRPQEVKYYWSKHACSDYEEKKVNTRGIKLGSVHSIYS